MTTPTGWALLHSPLPKEALKPLSRDVYGVDGLTDVNEGFLIERLIQSGLKWSWTLDDSSYCGSEERTPRGKDYTVTWYLASVRGSLVIDSQVFGGAGGHDNRKLDAAFKGASTVAFKNACKVAGLTVELYKGGKALDVIYDEQGSEPKPAPPPPPPGPGDMQYVPTGDEVADLERLATTLPGTPKDGKWVSELLENVSYRSVLAALRKKHGEQCGPDCEHVKAQTSLSEVPS